LPLTEEMTEEQKAEALKDEYYQDGVKP